MQPWCPCRRALAVAALRFLALRMEVHLPHQYSNEVHSTQCEQNGGKHPAEIQSLVMNIDSTANSRQCDAI